MHLKILPALVIATLIISSADAEPVLSNFEHLVLAPGESGKFRFTINNTYPSSMENVSIRAEIYKYSSFVGDAKNITEINNAPELENNIRNFSMIEKIESVEFLISTAQATPRGIYFVRLWLEFECNKTHCTMYSLGYFSSESLALYHETGALQANCSGVIPESSFRVTEPCAYEPAVGRFAPLWLLWLLIGLIAVFSILAVALYFKERR
ncbi:MAG: hypothetical protein QME47_01820 [Candidatus Thermoplasmatota archaeon]|nr:hypothetical protein [Candidatus Thermoplasmatota archaeon]